MRLIEMNTRSIEDIGYFDHGLLKCTPAGLVLKEVSHTPIEFTTDNGLAISSNVIPEVNGGKGMIGISSKAYKVLIDPMRFADIILKPDTQLAIATRNGKLLGTLHQPDLTQVQQLLDGKYVSATSMALRDLSLIHI